MENVKRFHLSDEDRKEIMADQRRNAASRLSYVRKYVAWLKKTPNNVWSKQHAKYLGK